MTLDKSLKVQCDNCATPKELEDLLEHELGYFCKSCTKSIFIDCSKCSNSKHTFLTNEINGAVLCQNCFDNIYEPCDTCASYVLKDDIQHIEEDRDEGRNEKYLCQLCFDGQELDGTIHDYSYTPRLKFTKQPWENTFYLGVELEINTYDVPSEHSKRFKSFLKSLEVDKQFFFKRDGSISQGYEIVTHPFTLQYAHSHIPFKEILGWLRENKATSYEQKECGLHVHVSKKDMSLLDIAKVKLFFWKAQSQIIKFSKRDARQMHFCKIETFEKGHIKPFLIGQCYQDGRHVAVNTENDKGTIEFRIFRGTLNYKRFMASLQFSEAVCEFVKEHGTGAIDSKKAWEHFMKWLPKKGSYHILEAYLLKHVGGK